MNRETMHWRVTSLVFAALLAISASTARAQEKADKAPALSIDDEVGKLLYDRGVKLYTTGDYANAKKMFVESLERSPHGPVSSQALSMVRSANERLGISDLDSGVPEPGATIERPLDPYGDGGAEVPLDPYADPKTGEPGVIDPYAEPVDVGAGGASRAGRGAVFGFATGLGMVSGLALGGPIDDEGNLSGGAMAAAVGLGLAGAAGAYWVTRSHPVSAGEGTAIVSAGTWGAVDLALFGDAITGVNETSTNAGFKFVAAGGLLGTGAGVLYAYKTDPEVADVVLENSAALWGLGSGLLLGVAISPPTGEAYSLNAAIGSAIGLTAGLIASSRIDLGVRRTLWLDAGAAVGAAAPWVVLYPLLADGDTNDDEQVAGGLSAFALLGGVIGAYWLTDSDTAAADQGHDDGELSPALLSRSFEGQWHLGAPPLLPMINPRLSPPAGTAVGIAVAAGRF